MHRTSQVPMVQPIEEKGPDPRVTLKSYQKPCLNRHGSWQGLTAQVGSFPINP